MNGIVLTVSGLVLVTLAYGCDASNTSGTGLADAGSQGGAGTTGGSGGAHTGTGGARTGTGGTRANVGGALGTGGARVGTGGTGTAGATANAVAFCTLQGQVAAQLNCPGFTSQQALVTSCVATTSLPATCQSPLDAATACLSQQPTSSFTCSTSNDGSTEVNSGVCTTQADALVSCVLGGAGTCSDLTGCCSQLSGTDQSSCQQIVTGADDATCGAALSIYQSAALCM